MNRVETTIRLILMYVTVDFTHSCYAHVLELLLIYFKEEEHKITVYATPRTVHTLTSSDGSENCTCLIAALHSSKFHVSVTVVKLMSIIPTYC